MIIISITSKDGITLKTIYRDKRKFYRQKTSARMLVFKTNAIRNLILKTSRTEIISGNFPERKITKVIKIINLVLKIDRKASQNSA